MLTKQRYLEKVNKLRQKEERELAKTRRVIACLSNAIRRDDRPKIEKWQRLLLKHYGIYKDSDGTYKERR